MSSQWSRLVAKPAGAIPGGLFGQIAVGLTTLLIAAFIIAYAIQGGDTEDEVETTSSEPVLSGEGMQRRVEHTIEQQQRLEQTRRAARARDRLRAQMRQPRPGQQARPGRPPVRTAGLTRGQPPIAGGADGGDPLDGMIDAEIAEQELLQELKLQSIRRKHESLRSQPVAQSLRSQPDRTLPAMRDGNPPSRSVRRPSDPDIEGLLHATENLMRLENENVAPAASSEHLLAPLATTGPSAPAGGGPVAAQNQPPAHSPENPARVTTPADPDRFERIYEGSFLEGALITQLSGDFPGPALA